MGEFLYLPGVRMTIAALTICRPLLVTMALPMD
jgi:hypothetical protein